MGVPPQFALSGLEQQARMSGWGPKSMIAPIWGFFDESGEEDKTGALKRLTLGGFVAPWPAVEDLCKRWRIALDEESLSEFHMKEIASDEHSYEEWEPERKAKLNKFLAILSDCAAHFCMYSYPVTNKKSPFVSAYKPGLGRALHDLEDACLEHGARDNIVFAKTPEISEEFIGRYFHLVNWKDAFDGYGVRRSAREPALQAAEIVARAMKQFMQDGLVTRSFLRIRLTNKPVRFWPPDRSATLSVHPR